MAMVPESSGLSISSQGSSGSLTTFTIDPPSSVGATQWDAEDMAGLDSDGLPFDRQAGPATCGADFRLTLLVHVCLT